MKTLATSALAICLLVLVGCAEGNAPSPDTTATIAEAKNKIEANVEGMDCTGCSGSIMAAVESIEGVTACHADVATGDVKVALADDADTDAKLLEIESVLQGLQEGKYTVKSITAWHPADRSEEALPATPANEEPAAEEPATDEQASAQPAVKVIASYKVTGMDCTGCSSQIVNAVKAVDGVQTVEADHKTGAVRVAFDDRFDDKRKTDEIKDLIATLSDGKYNVSY